MKSMRSIILFVTTLSAVGLIPVLRAATSDELAQTARSASMELGKALKGRLQAELQTNGVVGALAVCHLEAPGIAGDISATRLLSVRRTSLRVRNAANAPDDWERAGLVRLQERLSAGEDPAHVEFWETVTGADGEEEFRYLKAIPTEALCLTCHGAEIDPVVSAEILSRYPADAATGFAVGELRGAFSVRLPVRDQSAP